MGMKELAEELKARRQRAMAISSQTTLDRAEGTIQPHAHAVVFDHLEILVAHKSAAAQGHDAGPATFDRADTLA